ncbi:MAG: hypothetical protein IPO61_07525 [Gammaproteobacteria bacterium]|nr:hypothetical protein [Gammaproteobacteria bacterium]
MVVHLHLNDSLGIEKLLEYARAGCRPTRFPSRCFSASEALPRNATNKVLKALLKEKYAAVFEGEGD